MFLERTSIQKSDTHYEFIIDAPGADPGSLGVNIEGGILDVEWTRKGARRSSSFVLKTDCFDVPASSYTYEDGVVSVKVPLKTRAVFSVPIRSDHKALTE